MGRRRRGRIAATAVHRRVRHPVAPLTPDPRRLGSSQTRQRRRRHHGHPARPGFVICGGARTTRDRQNLHRCARHHTAGRRARLAYRRCRTIACRGGESARLHDRRRHRSATCRKEAIRPPRRPVAADRRERIPRIHHRHRGNRGMRDRRYGVGLRQPQPCSAGQPGSAGDRRSRPVLLGQHHRRGTGGRQPAAARRPAAAARAPIPNRSTGPR